MKVRATVLFAAAGLVLASTIRAATFIVPDDAQLVANADAVIAGTCIGSWARTSDEGHIETVFQIAVDETLVGEVDSSTIEIVEPGGHTARSWVVVPGAPDYSPGERYVIVLGRRDDGRWSTSDLTLGRFRFERGMSGNELLVRDAAEIHGWSEDGSPHVERTRAARPFMDFIRNVAAQRRVRADYFVDDQVAEWTRTDRTGISTSAVSELTPGRRFTFELADYPARQPDRVFEWHVAGSIPGLDLPAAVAAGVARWSGAPGSTIRYVASEAPASGDTWGNDGESRIIAGDPHGQVQGTFGRTSTIVAASFVGCTDCEVIEHNGEPFYAITYADVVINDGISSANMTQEKLVTAVTHELGHTLGFRHSDQPPASAGECGEQVPCTRNAVMNSTVVTGIDGTLQAWDEIAVLSIYGNGIGCVPVIVDQPTDTLSLDYGAQAAIRINVYSYVPVSYHWYEGERGDTSLPVPGATTDTLIIPPVASTTSYWVRISSDCGSVDSRATHVVALTSRSRGVRRH